MIFQFMAYMIFALYLFGLVGTIWISILFYINEKKYVYLVVGSCLAIFWPIAIPLLLCLLL